MPRSQTHEGVRRLLPRAGAVLLLLFPLACPPVPSTCVADPAAQVAGGAWISGPTRLSRLSPEEKRLLLGYRPSAESARRPRYRLTDPRLSALLFAAGLPLPKTDDLPASWDWREHQGVTPIKDQGLCGSCWAFCSVGAIEGCAYINDHIVHDLSEQQMLSCNDDGYGCRGGEMASCYEIFRDYGAIAEEEMPYQAADGIPCRQEEAEPLARISGWIDLANDVATIKAALYNYGPIPCAMVVHEDFLSYMGDCYEHSPGGDLNHCVLIVGWDDNVCGGIWICKNSWNTDWGEEGFFRIQWGSADIGSHASALLYLPRAVFDFAHVPVVTTTTSNGPFVIDAQITSRLAPVDPVSVKLHFRVDGAEFETAMMHPSGEEDGWQGEIPAQRIPSTIDYYIEAADQEGHAGTLPARAPEDCFSFDVAFAFDPCERPDSSAGGSGWRVGEPDDGATTGIWECVDPVGTQSQPEDDHTPWGSCCWVTGQHTQGQESGANDVDGGKTTLLSPTYELFGVTTARVKYWRWYSNDRGAAPEEDIWLVQARNEDGPWRDLERTDRSSNAWVRIEKDLFETLGPCLGKVRFRFVAADTGRGSAVEAAIDDFTLLADPDPLLLGWNQAPGLSPGQPLPNPSRGSAIFRIEVGEQTAARIRVYDVGGRLVATPLDDLLGRGRHAIAWDGRDSRGGPVCSGVYFGVLDLGGLQSRSRIVIVR